MADTKKVLTTTASGAAMGAPLGPWGAAAGAAGGFLYGMFGGGDDNEAAPPAPMQYGGNPLTNQLAAQQYAAGLQEQQAQNAREAAFYNQANGNFDIANAAQMRGGSQISSTAADKQRQIAALTGTNSAIGNVNQTGQQLTDLGTRPMGPSYAEAQLRQGQDAAMAQQLSMARSGRSLGSGQAAMQQAAFNNAGLNQQTNLAAANARIQEQNAYNQFQAGALSAAGQQYGAAGALSGQAGNQATGIRQGNETVQLQNAQLQQAQQGINNQTTGLYNQLGAQQQGYGMQANTTGQQAQQFGQTQASNMMTSQLQADQGRLNAATQIATANQTNANAHDAATVNALSSGTAATADAVKEDGSVDPNEKQSNQASGASANGSPTAIGSSPSGSSSGPKNPDEYRSDERLKKNIVPTESLNLTGSKSSSTGAAPGKLAAPPSKNPYEGFSPADAAAYRAADQAAATGQSTYTANGKTLDLHPHGDGPMDEDTRKIAAPGEGPQQQPPSYAETIAALQAGYRPSQMAPTDVLNHVAGAGAGPSASQAAVIARMQGKPPPVERLPATQAGGIEQKMKDSNYGIGENVASGSALSAAGHAMIKPAATPGIQRQSIPLVGATRAAQAAPTAPAAWGDVFNTPQLDPRIAAYLAGANPYPVASAAPAPTITSPRVNPDEYRGSEQGGGSGGYIGDSSYDLNRLPGERSSDAHSKTRIRELEGQLAALQGTPTASFAPQQPDTASLDSSVYGQQVRGGAPSPGWRDRDQLSGPSSYPHRWDADPFATKPPSVDLRGARGYEYEYKQPGPGAPPGRHVGPMAQDLEHTAAAGTVRDTPHGKVVDTQGLTMVNTAALSEQQRKTEELERQLAAIQAAQAPKFDPGIYPTTQAPY